jgi:hypothetical protein
VSGTNQQQEIVRLQKELAASQRQAKQYRQLLHLYLQEEWRGVSRADLEAALDDSASLDEILSELEEGTHA